MHGCCSLRSCGEIDSQPAEGHQSNDQTIGFVRNCPGEHFDLSGGEDRALRLEALGQTNGSQRARISGDDPIPHHPIEYTLKHSQRFGDLKADRPPSTMSATQSSTWEGLIWRTGTEPNC